MIKERFWINNGNKENAGTLLEDKFIKTTSDHAEKNKSKLTIIYKGKEIVFDYTPEEDERSRRLKEAVAEAFKKEEELYGNSKVN